MKTEELHASLAKEVLQRHSSEDDALALMILLHTHRVRLRQPTLDDRPEVLELAALTQRHVAEVMAAMWPDRADLQRTDRRYWYYQFNARTPYEVIDDIPPDWMLRVQRLRERLVSNPIVNSFEPED